MPALNNKITELQEVELAVQQYLKDFNLSYKLEIIKINISSSFMVRSICKECGSHPTYYYYTRKPFQWKDVNQQIAASKWFRTWIKRLTSDWYLRSQPSYFYDIHEFSVAFADKGYKSSINNKRGLSVNNKDDIMEMLGCECGATIWAFNQKSVKSRPEIVNRKGRYAYPHNFEY